MRESKAVDRTGQVMVFEGKWEGSRTVYVCERER